MFAEDYVVIYKQGGAHWTSKEPLHTLTVSLEVSADPYVKIQSSCIKMKRYLSNWFNSTNWIKSHAWISFNYSLMQVQNTLHCNG